MESEWVFSALRSGCYVQIDRRSRSPGIYFYGLISLRSNKHLKLIIVDLLQKHTHQHELNFQCLTWVKKAKANQIESKFNSSFFLLKHITFVSRSPNIEKSWSLLNWLQAKTKLVIKLKIYILGLRAYILTKNWLKQTHGRQDQRRKKKRNYLLPLIILFFSQYESLVKFTDFD